MRHRSTRSARSARKSLRVTVLRAVEEQSRSLAEWSRMRLFDARPPSDAETLAHLASACRLAFSAYSLAPEGPAREKVLADQFLLLAVRASHADPGAAVASSPAASREYPAGSSSHDVPAVTPVPVPALLSPPPQPHDVARCCVPADQPARPMMPLQMMQMMTPVPLVAIASPPAASVMPSPAEPRLHASMFQPHPFVSVAQQQFIQAERAAAIAQAAAMQQQQQQQSPQQSPQQPAPLSVAMSPQSVSAFVTPLSARPAQPPRSATETPPEEEYADSKSLEPETVAESSYECAAPPKQKRRKRAKNPAAFFCHICGTTETSEWRRGPDNCKSLCNACGLHYAKIVKKEQQMASKQGTFSVRDLLSDV
eukprot:m51a1_g4603 putative gata-binding transcription factor (368) ;mRNA; f:234939-236312